MSSLNEVRLMGNLCADAETRFTPSGKSVCTLRLATNEYYMDATGKAQTRPEFHRVVVWGKQAVACGKVLKKGRLVLVQGRLQTRSYDDKDGQRRYITEVVSSRVQFLPMGAASAKTQVAPTVEETAPVAEEENAAQPLHQSEVDWR